MTTVMDRQDERLRRFDALGRSLAAAFNADGVEGGGWTHEAGHAGFGSVTLRHPRGLRLWVWHLHGNRKGAAGRRLTVEGAYPHGYDGPTPQSITVSMDREPVPMARDIVRRLLPNYLATIDHALEQARVAQRERQARIVMNRRLEQTLPALALHQDASAHQAPDRKSSYWYGGRFCLSPSAARASGTVRLNDDASHMDVNLTDVPADVALQILALLDSRTVLEGTLVPRALAPAQRELPVPAKVIAGELVSQALAGHFGRDAEPLPVHTARPHSPLLPPSTGGHGDTVRTRGK